MKLNIVPVIVVVALIGAILAIVFLAPSENAKEALTGTSVVGLLLQAVMRSVVSRGDS